MKLSLEQIQDFVSEPYYSRGVEYYEDGMIELTSKTEKKVKAKCLGSSLYEVTLELTDKELTGNCTCPAFDSFEPCKHIATVGFAVLEDNQGFYEPSDEYLDYAQTIEIARKNLAKKKKEELIEIIIAMSDGDEEYFDE